ncbi:MAG: hypothetical protein QM704_10770 [Anaeromyxobacteraceae bacterium]
MTSRTLAAVLAAAALSTGCATTRFTCPARGGTPWREVRTQTLVVRTDLGPSEAASIAQELERLHEAIRRAFFRNPPPVQEPLHVTAFRNRAEFEPFAPPMAAAYYFMNSDAPIVVLHGPIDLRTRETLAHELTHHVLAQVFRRQPLWFAEGMAVYMESIASRGAFLWTEDPTIGGRPRAASSVTSSAARVRQVLTATRSLNTAEYAVAWAIVHYISNHEKAGFAELQRRFAAAEDPAAAWRATFPRWDPASDDGMKDLDRRLRAYMQGGTYQYRRVALPAFGGVEERPLTPPEVHGIRLELPRYPRLVDRSLEKSLVAFKAEVLAETDEALAEDPAQLTALVTRAAFAPAEIGDLARRATAAHPHDPRAWRLAAVAMPADDHAGRVATLRRALEERPQDTATLVALAKELVGAARPEEALELVTTAATRAPASPWPPHVRASALLALGRCPDALAAQRHAAEIASGRLEEPWAEPISRQLAELEQRCGSPPAPAGTAAPGPGASP